MKLFAPLVLAALIVSGCAQPAEKQIDTSNYPNEVTDAVEQMRKQLVDPQRDALKNLTSENLTYGHSNGVIEDKAEFIESLISEKFNFTSVEQTEQTIDISGETAIVRHQLFGNTHDAGKDPGTANLKVLQVWQKKGGDWKLLARQAVRITAPQ